MGFILSPFALSRGPLACNMPPKVHLYQYFRGNEEDNLSSLSFLMVTQVFVAEITHCSCCTNSLRLSECCNCIIRIEKLLFGF